MKLTFSAFLTAVLLLACFGIDTETPLLVALALWCAFVLGTLFGIEGYRKITDRLK